MPQKTTVEIVLTTDVEFSDVEFIVRFLVS